MLFDPVLHITPGTVDLLIEFSGSYLISSDIDAFFLTLVMVVLILGGALIYLTLRQGVSGAYKIFLILAGAGAAATGIGIFLHNAISALIETISGKKDIEGTSFLHDRAIWGSGCFPHRNGRQRSNVY